MPVPRARSFFSFRHISAAPLMAIPAPDHPPPAPSSSTLDHRWASRIADGTAGGQSPGRRCATGSRAQLDRNRNPGHRPGHPLPTVTDLAGRPKPPSSPTPSPGKTSSPPARPAPTPWPASSPPTPPHPPWPPPPASTTGPTPPRSPAPPTSTTGHRHQPTPRTQPSPGSPRSSSASSPSSAPSGYSAQVNPGQLPRQRRPTARTGRSRTARWSPTRSDGQSPTGGPRRVASRSPSLPNPNPIPSSPGAKPRKPHERLDISLAGLGDVYTAPGALLQRRIRGMAQFGSASALGAEGRRFKSGYPDRALACTVKTDPLR